MFLETTEQVDRVVQTLLPTDDQCSLLDFTFAIQNRIIARELRDMIHNHLLDEILSHNEGLDIISRYRMDPPLIYDPALVCSSFAAEAVELLYKKAHHYVKDPTTITTYMQADGFGVGITPDSVAIKALGLRICILPANYDQVLEQLDFLTSMEVSNDFKLRVNLEHGTHFYPKDVYAIVKKAQFVQDHFEKKGYKARVTYEWDGLYSFGVDKFLDWTEEKIYEELMAFMPDVRSPTSFCLAANLNSDNGW